MLYLLRHGLATHAKKYTRNILSARLLAEGIIQAKNSGQKLKKIKTDANYCSPLPRAKMTSEIVSKISGKKFIFDARLAEKSQETFLNFKKRVKSFIDEELKDKQGQNVLIITHGVVIAAIKHFLSDGDFKKADYLDYPETGEMEVLKN